MSLSDVERHARAERREYERKVAAMQAAREAGATLDAIAKAAEMTRAGVLKLLRRVTLL